MLSSLIQSIVSESPKGGNRRVRTLGARIRDQPIGTSGCTPRSIVNGWFNVTPLQSALRLISEIPPDFPFSDWVRVLVSQFTAIFIKRDIFKHRVVCLL